MVPQGTVWNFDYDFEHGQNAIVKDVLVNYALKTADDFGYQWTVDVLEEKLAMVFKNVKSRNKLTPQQRETERQRSQKRGVRNKVRLYFYYYSNVATSLWIKREREKSDYHKIN